MKRKLLFLFLVAIIAVLAFLYTRPTLPTLAVDKVYGVTERGKTILVNVTLNNVPACNGWLVDLTWDPEILRVSSGPAPYPGGPSVAMTEGSFLKNIGYTHFSINSIDNDRGETVVGAQFFSVGTSASGSGVLLSINFTVLQVGTTTIEINPPSPTLNQSIVTDAQGTIMDHAEVYGLVTNEGPPPIWTDAEFQSTALLGEVAVLGVMTVIGYLKTHPRPPKSARRKAELQPIVDSKDQVESD